MVTAGHAVGVGVHDALRQVVRVRRSSSDGQAPPPTVRSVLLGLESVLYTVLLAAALLALSNSSATLREVIDAVRG